MILKLGIKQGASITSDDDVLETAGDRAVARFVENGLIASVQPQYSSLVSDHHLVRFLSIVPVSGLELVSSNAKFASHSNRNNLPGMVDDLGMRMRH
jgi:hypothetical protein